jgi:hypothetical protein
MPAPAVDLIGPVGPPVGTNKASVSPSLITGLAVLIPPKTALVALRFCTCEGYSLIIA